MKTRLGKRALAMSALAWCMVPGMARAAGCSLSVFKMPVTMEGLRASVPVKVNGKQTSFWLDSGAWYSIMSQAKAQELGLPLKSAPYGMMMEGIGGSFTPQVATIRDFAVVGSELNNVDFIVGGSDSGNGLIGRNLLAQSDTEFDLRDGYVSLARSKGCEHANMAYWAPGKPYFTVELKRRSERDGKINNFALPVKINNTVIGAEIDTGATTVISRRAAERAGIALDGPGVKPITGIGGFGRHYERGWLVPVDSVSVGSETILHPRLVVIDGPITSGDGSPDMLLGIGFVLAHHIYVARDQDLIYFTYSGGNPFVDSADYDGDGSSTPASGPGTNPTALPAGTHRVEAFNAAPQPTTAADFARRGAARLAQNNTFGAISDFTSAIAIEPDNAAYFRGRAQAKAQAGDKAAARADFNQAIKLAPRDPDLLSARAWMRIEEHDDAGALADAQAARLLIPAGSLDMLPIAGMLERLGHAADAAALYGPVIAAHRDDSRFGALLNGRCWSRALADVEIDDALADCKKALKLTGNETNVRDSLALVLYRKGKYADALAEYDAVLKDKPDMAWSRYMRGMTRAALGDTAGGKTDREAALKADPTVEERARRYKLTPPG